MAFGAPIRGLPRATEGRVARPRTARATAEDARPSPPANENGAGTPECTPGIDEYDAEEAPPRLLNDEDAPPPPPGPERPRRRTPRVCPRARPRRRRHRRQSPALCICRPSPLTEPCAPCYAGRGIQQYAGFGHLGENAFQVLLFSHRGLDSSVWFVVAGSRLMDLEVGRFEDGSPRQISSL